MNLDQTYCASYGCKNKCGRKIPEHMAKYMANHPASSQYNVWVAYFCDLDGELIVEKEGA